MLMTEIIKRKRDGGSLSPQEIREVIHGYTAGLIPDYQMAALLMALFIRGMSPEELKAWTDAMLHSGKVLDLSSIPGPKADKHSTGGVGDKVSIPLAPLVAACGVKVPMISGRGLGHTGGTLDKLESIPGFRTNLSPDLFVAGIRDIGVCMIGQTEDLAPADRKVYALRDATATVDSIPLIAASIMSKKLAEGISALVLDVKVGSGAFMKTLDQARTLAQTMVTIGQAAGVHTVAYLTDMSQPLGWAVGNALEIEESIAVLRGKGPEDTTRLVTLLGGTMLALCKVVRSVEEGEEKIRAAIASGAGLRKFKEMVAFQGGDDKVAEDPGLLPKASKRKDFLAPKEGYLVHMDCEQIGQACVVLGAGRRTKEDSIDPSVGFRVHKKIGHFVHEGEPILTIEYNDEGRMQEAQRLLERAIVVAQEAPEERPLVIERIGSII